jgi:hypothetical protein
LATPHVATALKLAGYEAFNERFHTDHRAYFLDFDTRLLLGTTTQSSAARILKTSNVAQVTQYIKMKYDFLMEHNVFERMERLSHPGNRHAYAERLGKDILAVSLAATVREPGMVKARRKVSFLSKCILMQKTRLSHAEQLYGIKQIHPLSRTNSKLQPHSQTVQHNSEHQRKK